MARSKNAGEQPLLTKKSLALALSPPRAPPIGTAHRSLLQASGDDPALLPLVFHHGSGESTAGRPLDRARMHLYDHLLHRHQIQPGVEPPQKMSYRSSKKSTRNDPHPHLPTGESEHRFTRFLGGILLPTSWHNSWRDSGTFRNLADTLVTISAPMVGLTAPSAIKEFMRLTRRCQRHKYGAHERQLIEVYLPTQQEQQSVSSKGNSRLVFFIHGGAWGSGVPWFYRLVAAPFVDHGVAVAIVGYRTYPCGRVEQQVHDCRQAARYMARIFPELCEHVTVMGHSSGAHIGMLMVLKEATQQMVLAQVGRKINESLLQRNNQQPRDEHFQIKLFVGISGPYDISHHFDYEASRGVEELSPMKAACGYTREAFRDNSPALRLQDTLVDEFQESETPMDDWIPPIILLHGIEDDTVPFTSTSEAARVLRCCGVSHCQEVYLARTLHQDTVMEVMLGGPTRDAVLKGMGLILSKSSTEDPKCIVKATSKL